MTHKVRAIYANGTLRLLEPIDLEQNQEVEVTVTVDEPPSEASNARLEALCGSWSKEDVEQITAAIEEAFEQVDPDEWE